MKSDLLANSGDAQGLAGLYGGNAANIYGGLQPTLAAESAAPMGYTPTQTAAQTTAAEQTAGGAKAGASGGAMLRAARTRNIGSAQPGIAEASRTASQNLSQTNAGIQNNSANLAAKRQAEAQTGLGSLYGENVKAGENALDISNTSLKNAGDLSNFWQTYLLQAQKDVDKMAGGGGMEMLLTGEDQDLRRYLALDPKELITAPLSSCCGSSLCTRPATKSSQAPGHRRPSCQASLSSETKFQVSPKRGRGK